MGMQSEIRHGARGGHGASGHVLWSAIRLELVRGSPGWVLRRNRTRARIADVLGCVWCVLSICKDRNRGFGRRPWLSIYLSMRQDLSV